MTGAWKGGLQFSNAVDIGTDLPFSQGFPVPGASSTYVKGSWQQVTASTTTDIAWLQIYIETQTSNGLNWALDIGMGASGSETVIVANLSCSQSSASGTRYLLPLTIPAGTRIALRASSSVANDQLIVALHGFSDAFTSAGTGSAIDTYGFISTSNVGLQVDPGATAGAKGAWVQLTASLTADIAGFVLAFDTQSTYNGTVGILNFLVDIGCGASGSEVIILPNYYLAGLTQAVSPIWGTLYGPSSGYLPIQVGAGTRIAVRAQCSTATSPDRLIGVIFYAVRQ